MDIMKIAAAGVIAALLTALFKKERAETALLICLGAGAVILTAAASRLEEIVEQVRRMAEMAGLSASVLKILLKILVIGYVTQFAAELCRDAGAASIGTKVETGGKLLIVAASLPVFSSLLGVITELFG